MLISCILFVILALYAILQSTILRRRRGQGLEPPVAPSVIPFFGHAIGMVRYGKSYYQRLRDQCQHPIVTLRLGGLKVYAVFSIPIIQSIQKQNKSFAFQPIQAKFSVKLCGASKDAFRILQKDMNQETGEYGTIYTAMHRALNPGEFLNKMSTESTARICDSINNIQSGASIKLDEWLRHQVTLATTHAVYGPHNPFQDPNVEKAFWAFERAIPSLIFLPKWMTHQGYQNRKIIADAFLRYFQNNHHEQASVLVRDFYTAEISYGFSESDRSLFEVGHAVATLANTYAAIFWLIFYVFSDSKALQTIRLEVSSITTTTVDVTDDKQTSRHVLDLTKINSHCPLLLSTFRETMRVHSVGISLREVCKDTILNNTYYLKRGATIIMPTIAIHTDPRIWGHDASSFKYDRFLSTADATGIQKDKVSPAAFRGFGGGSTLCPGRHFATTQIMVWISMLVMRFDIEPVSGQWQKPTTEKSNVANVITRPDHDIEVRLIPRCHYKDGIWEVRIAGSEATPSMTVDDFIGNQEVDSSDRI
ncbi:cytochrome P450 [Nemania sp. FL0916]|nr:cytochrome P450 [Nemania sp. FL0916]